jgi:hypothetical protein
MRGDEQDDLSDMSWFRKSALLYLVSREGTVALLSLFWDRLCRKGVTKTGMRWFIHFRMTLMLKDYLPWPVWLTLL